MISLTRVSLKHRIDFIVIFSFRFIVTRWWRYGALHDFSAKTAYGQTRTLWMTGGHLLARLNFGGPYHAAVARFDHGNSQPNHDIIATHSRFSDSNRQPFLQAAVAHVQKGSTA
jgi:hypothetical protein